MGRYAGWYRTIHEGSIYGHYMQEMYVWQACVPYMGRDMSSCPACSDAYVPHIWVCNVYMVYKVCICIWYMGVA